MLEKSPARETFQVCATLRGRGSIKFISEMLTPEEIADLRREANARGLALDIEVDGGIKVDNVDRVVRAGANVIVSGSGIFAESDYRTSISQMRQRAHLAEDASS